MKHSKTRRPDKQNPLLIFIFSFVAFFFLSVGAQVCLCVWRTEQDRDDRHHAAAQGPKDTVHWVGEVRGIDGDKEIESEEQGRCEQKREQA